MNNIIKRKWNQNSMVIIEDLQGMAFQAESGGHTFQISGIDGEGNAVALSGTPAGVMLRADGQDVTLTCSASEGVISATLPANAYSVPGRFGLTIFLTSDGQKTAIYAAVGTVGKTSSGTVAPPAGSDVVTLVNQINTAIAAIPANYNACFAPAYSTSGLYSVGQYVTYNGNLYRCNTAITTAETWTAAHWTQTNLGADVYDLKSAFKQSNSEYVISDWVQGIIGTSSNTRITTQNYMGLRKGNCRVKCNTGYLLTAYAWNGDTLLGQLKTNMQFSTASGNGLWINEFDFSWFPTYDKIKIVLKKSDESNISPTDGANCYACDYTDKTVSKENKAADAKAVNNYINRYTGGVIHPTKLTGAAIGSTGQVSSSLLTSLFYIQCVAGHTYAIIKDVETVSVAIAEFSDVPALSSQSSNYKYTTNLGMILIKANADDYIAFDIGGMNDFAYPVYDLTAFIMTQDKILDSKNIIYSTAEELTADGITDFDDFPANANITVYSAAISGDNAPTNLPTYQQSFSFTKFSTNGILEYAIATTLNSSVRKFYYNARNNVATSGYFWKGWKELANYDSIPAPKEAYTSSPIYFSVSVNQSNAEQGSTVDSIVEETTFSDVGCVLKLPSTYTPNGTPTPLIMHCHGTGQYVTSNSYQGIDALNYMMSAGYAVFDVNGSEAYADQTGTKGQTVGSPRTLEAYYKAYLYILEHYNIEEGIYVACKSAGGLAAINFANRYPETVKVLGLCYPVTDLYNQAWLHPWDGNLKEKIAEEYFFTDTTGATYEAAKVTGFNPIISNGTDTDLFISKPVKIWHGTADTVVNYQGSVDFINKVKHAGGYGIIRLMDGHGHSMGSGENIYNVECTAWFNRFRQTNNS